MKRILSIFIILILIITNVQFISSKAFEDDSITYYGSDMYKSLYENINFKDINNNWAKRYINKMSALSIIKGMGNDKFNPNDELSYEQSIILISRLMGLEKEAHKLGEASIKNNDTGRYKILSSYDYWIRGYIEVALKNIISKEEYDKITALSESQLENIDKIVGKRMIYYENDYGLNQVQLDNIEKQIRELEERKLTWQKSITREHIAIWVAGIMDLNSISGQDLQLVFNLKDWENIETKNIPMIEAIIKERIMVGNTNNEFKPKGSLTRAEMTKILDMISEKFLIQQGYTINSGIVDKVFETKEIEKDKFNNNDINITKKEFSINNDNDNKVKLITQTSYEGVNEKGFIAYKKNSLSVPKDIEVLDYIKYYINPEGKVIFVEVLDNKVVEIEGLIEEVNENEKTIKIIDYKNNIHVFNIASGADITTNNVRMNLEDLLYGQEVKLKLNNGIVTQITGYLEEGEPGYIYPGDKIYIGKVLYVDTLYNKLTLLDDNQELDFNINEDTSILKENSNINFRNIREGDTVRLEFDEYNSSYPSRIYVSNKDKDILNIYKAKITYYNFSRNEIALDEVNYYKNSKWNQNDGLISIDLDYNTNIYKDGEKITNKDLSKYINKEAYIATINDYGKEKAYKIIIKTDYETSYNDRLQDISFGFKNITLDYKEIQFDYDSTIIVKDDKLIHPYNLNYGDTLSLVAQGINSPIATFISVVEPPKTGIIVYRGKIDAIGKYNFTINKLKIIEDSRWYHKTGEKDLTISNNTKIIDTRDIYKEISVEEFINSRYIINNDENSFYGQYVYAIEYDNTVIGFNIINKETEAEVLSIGNINTLDIINNKVTIENIKDFDRVNNKWNINDSIIELDLNEALIIKNGKTINHYQILKDDSLYVLRKNHEAYVVIVK